MTRFRAFDSDSSDEDDEQQLKPVSSEPDDEEPEQQDEESESEDEEDVQEYSEEESGSDDSAMLEDQLIERRRRSRKTIIPDEDGEFQVNDEDEEEENSPRSSPSRRSPAGDHTGANQNPSIIPWARHLGVDAQKMHVMQSSLFRMPEEAAELRALNQQQPPTRPKVVAALAAPSMNRKHSRDSDDGARTESRERASFAHGVHRSGPGPSRKYARVEVEHSIMDEKEGAYVDAGLALGRSFRVGWGPGGKLAHAGTICTPSASSSKSANSSIINITQTPFPPRPQDEDSSPASISEKLLQHHLAETTISRTESGVPLASPATSMNFASFASIFPNTQLTGPAPLFRLGSALFDPIELRLRSQGDIRTRVTLLKRRQALSTWLENVVKPSVEGDMRIKATGPIPGTYTEADTVFTALTGHQVEHACSLAMDAKYFKLATLISQAGGDETFKADIRSQLEIWKEEKLAPGGNALIGRGVWKIYRLLSMPDDSSADWVDEVCTGLDWKRVFGLCLWYGLGVDAAVADVVRLYEGLTKRYSPTTVARPLPKWKLDSKIPSGGLATISRGGLFASTSGSPPRQPEDPQYSLIRLHADSSLSLTQVLEPQSFGPDHRYGGIGMCWHLYIILSRAMKLRDFADRTSTHISHTANMLTTSYASALEGWGMLQEAAFVLLHLEDAEGRRKALKDLLARSARRIDEWMTRGLVGSLKIPITWLHEAKAIHAMDEKNIYEAYELYLSAQLWNSAHDLAVLELAPDAILRRDIPLLQELFEPFDLEGRRDKVEGWYVRGKIFVDYTHILTRLPQLQDKLLNEREAHAVVVAAPGESSTAEEIDDLTRKIPKLIALLPDVLYRSRSTDDRHAAAIEEMTQSLLSVMGKVKPTMLLKQAPLNFMDPSTKLALIRGKSYARFLQRVASEA